MLFLLFVFVIRDAGFSSSTRFAEILYEEEIPFFSFSLSNFSLDSFTLLFSAPFVEERFFFNLARKRLEMFLKMFKILLLVRKRSLFSPQDLSPRESSNLF